MSDLTAPKKRPQRPAAPSWAARRRPRGDGAEPRSGSDPDGRAPDSRAAVSTDEPAPQPSAAPALAPPPRVPRPAVPRSEAPTATSPSPQPAAGATADRLAVDASTTAARLAGNATTTAARVAVGSGAQTARPAAGVAPAPGEPKSATETLPPGTPIAPGLRPSSSEEPETVSLRDIETLLSPGKAPPRLPAAGARAGAGRLGAAPSITKTTFRGGLVGGPAAVPPRAPLDSYDDHEPVPRSSRWGDTHGSDLSAMAALVPAPRATGTRSAWPPPDSGDGPPSTLERALPNPLEASAADLELMGMLGAVAPKRPVESKPAWAPAPAGAQARASTVAVLSPEATAALKGARPAAPATGAWRPGAGAAAPPGRSPTLRSTAVLAERPAAQTKQGVVIPPPPVRVGPPQRKPSESVDVDEGWTATGEPGATERTSALPAAPTAARGQSAGAQSAADDARTRSGATGQHTAPGRDMRTLPGMGRHAAAGRDMRTLPGMGQHAAAAADVRPYPDATGPDGAPDPGTIRELEALQMRAGHRASLPDTAELLRDTPGSRRSHGSVVDPLELYGAISPPRVVQPSQPALPRAPEQALPKVMLQAPTRSLADVTSGAAAAANAEVKAAAAALAAAEMRAAAAALAAAEAKAAAAAAEANAAALRPRVDLPPRIEPRPFPKPPARPAAARAAVMPSAAAAKIESKPATPALPKVPPTPPAPMLQATRSGVAAAVWDSHPEPLDDDEIPVDMTPDVADAADGPPARTEPGSGPTSDSGRFDLHQLMSVREAPRSSKKGLGDADLFGLAGDLFAETDPGKIRPPDLSALARPAPLSARVLAPVATVSASLAPPTPRGTDKRGRARTLAPWVLLPVLAMAAAVVMVWIGRGSDPTPDPHAATAPGQRDPAPTTTAAAPPSTAATRPATEEPSLGDTAQPAALKPSDSAPTPTVGAWKPPPSAATSTAPTSPVATAPPPAVTTAAPTATAPPPSGNDFNEGAARAALRNAAGAAAGCAHDKPGSASVSITFAPSGRVTSSQVSGGFAGTTTGGCIASAMRSASVPAFEGGPVSVNWKVVLR